MAASHDQVESWIDQAEADLMAAGASAEGIAECHRRYWLQQSYEKAVKAFGLMLWREEEAGERAAFERLFLVHSPLKSLEEAKKDKLLTKALDVLRRQLDTELGKIDGSDLLRRIDQTTPMKDPSEVSYRYPFMHEGKYIAPKDYEGWDAYQGCNIMGAQGSLKKLHSAVKRHYQKSFLRAPK